MATSPITPQTAISSNSNVNRSLITPSDDVVSERLIGEFENILLTYFPDANKLFINDAAIVAAFLQSTRLFDSLFIREGDQRLRDGYDETVAHFIKKFEKPKNVLTRTFCRLMRPHDFNPEFHVITFTGNASGSFGYVVKNKLLFKDMVGWVHGQYTHTLQWYGVCLLCDHYKEFLPGSRKFNHSIGDLYAWMVGPRTTKKFPGETQPDGTPKASDTKSVWDICVDCFLDKDDEKKLEDWWENLYTSSYRSPANITNALLTGSLCNTWMGSFMQGRESKYQGSKGKNFFLAKKFQRSASARQQKKGRLHFRATENKKNTYEYRWVKEPQQGPVTKPEYVWIDQEDEELRTNLEKAIIESMKNDLRSF